MPEKEQVSCKIVHKMERFLSHYQAKHDLNNSQIYDLAAERFLTWLKAHPEERVVLRSMPSTATPLRGYMQTHLKEQLAQYADTEHHILMDLYYTIIYRFCEEEGYQDTVPVACFVSHDLFDHMTHAEPEALDVNTHVWREEFKNFVSSWATLSPRKKKTLEIKAPSLSGARLDMHLPSETVLALEAIKRELGCSLQGLYSQVVRSRYEKQGWCERVPVRCILSKNLAHQCEEFIENKMGAKGRPDSKSELMERAVERFLAFYGSVARDKNWEPRTPLLDGELFEAYVSEEKASALAKLPHPIDELFYTSLEQYSEEEGIKSGYRELKATKTPSSGLTVLYLEPEQQEIIDFLVRSKKFKDDSAFYHEAAKWWLEKREKVQGFYDQYLAYQHLTKEDGVLEVSASIRLPVHQAIKYYAKLDGQTIRTVYNNAISEFLDHLMENMDPQEATITLSIDHLIKDH